MNVADINDTTLDESPPTIAYALLALTSMAFDFKIAVVEGIYDETLVLLDESSGFEYLRMKVSIGMGSLLVAILNNTAQELADAMKGDEPWILNR